MKNEIFAVIILCLATPVAAVHSSSPKPSNPPERSVGKVRILQSNPPEEISVLSDGHARQVKGGEEVRVGETVTTRPDQSASIELEGGSQILLSPGTQVQVQSHSETSRETNTRMLKGLAHFSISPSNGPRRFFVRTASAVMGVRGTEFVVEHDDAKGTGLHTLEGSVEIGKSPESFEKREGVVRVDAGHESAIAPNASAPQEAKVFNRRTFRRYLHNASPAFNSKVEQLVRARAIQNRGSGAGETRHEKTHKRWEPPKKRRKIPRHSS